MQMGRAGCQPRVSVDPNLHARQSYATLSLMGACASRSCLEKLPRGVVIRHAGNDTLQADETGL